MQHACWIAFQSKDTNSILAQPAGPVPQSVFCIPIIIGMQSTIDVLHKPRSIGLDDDVEGFYAL